MAEPDLSLRLSLAFRRRTGQAVFKWPSVWWCLLFAGTRLQMPAFLNLLESNVSAQPRAPVGLRSDCADSDHLAEGLSSLAVALLVLVM